MFDFSIHTEVYTGFKFSSWLNKTRRAVKIALNTFPGPLKIAWVTSYCKKKKQTKNSGDGFTVGLNSSYTFKLKILKC